MPLPAAADPCAVRYRPGCGSAALRSSGTGRKFAPLDGADVGKGVPPAAAMMSGQKRPRSPQARSSPAATEHGGAAGGGPPKKRRKARRRASAQPGIHATADAPAAPAAASATAPQPPAPSPSGAAAPGHRQTPSTARPPRAARRRRRRRPAPAQQERRQHQDAVTAPTPEAGRPQPGAEAAQGAGVSAPTPWHLSPDEVAREKEIMTTFLRVECGLSPAAAVRVWDRHHHHSRARYVRFDRDIAARAWRALKEVWPTAAASKVAASNGSVLFHFRIEEIISTMRTLGLAKISWTAIAHRVSPEKMCRVFGYLLEAEGLKAARRKTGTACHNIIVCGVDMQRFDRRQQELGVLQRWTPENAARLVDQASASTSNEAAEGRTTPDAANSAFYTFLRTRVGASTEDAQQMTSTCRGRYYCDRLENNWNALRAHLCHDSAAQCVKSTLGRVLLAPELHDRIDFFKALGVQIDVAFRRVYSYEMAIARLGAVLALLVQHRGLSAARVYLSTMPRLRMDRLCTYLDLPQGSVDAFMKTEGARRWDTLEAVRQRLAEHAAAAEAAAAAAIIARQGAAARPRPASAAPRKRRRRRASAARAPRQQEAAAPPAAARPVAAPRAAAAAPPAAAEFAPPPTQAVWGAK
eukprot:TRINITY_DN337_c0_g1_i3.p1 TRINITY_DN337_c0_g1~~TRINITY_DN337_c0_g1_i3.p1  ORF type:complete len:669 (+),score=116.86 TRINITY_DN337_c0_g1_i3:96-2009(+)